MTEKEELKRNLEWSGAMEELTDISISQPAKDRRKYMDTALEALSTSTGKAKLIQRLYDDIISKKNFDTSDIDATMGNLTKLPNYTTTAQAIDALNQLYGDSPSKTMKLLNELYGYVIKFRPDFEYAYKTENDVLQSYYQVSVMMIMELINYTAAEYVGGLRDSVATVPGLTTKPGKKFLSVANKITRVYRTGSWTKLVNSYKKDMAKTIKKAGYSTANEAFGDGLMNLSRNAMAATGFVQGVLQTGLGKFGTAIVALSMFAVAAAAMFGIVMLFLSAMRLGVYWFYSSNARLSDYWATQANILEFNIESNKADPNNSKKEAKLKKLKERVNFINAKILKTEKIMDTEIAEANREKFSAEELRDFTPSVSDDNDFMF